MIQIEASNIIGLPEEELEKFQNLIDIYNYYSPKNKQKEKYYEGNISLDEVNLGVALPDGLSKLEIGCAWGAKTVDVLAGRSMFDGFVGVNGEDLEDLDRITDENNLVDAYMKACRDELKNGCCFATLSKGENGIAKIRFHSAQTAAADWDGDKGRISRGFAIVDAEPIKDSVEVRPVLINYHTDTAIWVLKRTGNDVWEAEAQPHKMGRPLMEPLVWNSTSIKPFGRSRIKEPIRRLIQGYVRTVANATIGLEFSTTPQKYLLGVTDEQFDAVVNNKFRQYVGSIFTSTTNPETGEKPTFGQLTQGTIGPHVEMLRMLATQFSAATGLTVSDVGVVNDANPTSSDAILAQSQTLVGMAQQLNEGNGNALRTIALMALAITKDKKLEELTDEEKNVMAHFKNPAMPSVAVTADAAIKIASARQGFAGTDTFLEMIGFDKADIRRIKAQEARNRGLQLVEGLNDDNGAGVV